MQTKHVLPSPSVVPISRALNMRNGLRLQQGLHDAYDYYFTYKFWLKRSSNTKIAIKYTYGTHFPSSNYLGQLSWEIEYTKTGPSLDEQFSNYLFYKFWTCHNNTKTIYPVLQLQLPGLAFSFQMPSPCCHLLLLYLLTREHIPVPTTHSLPFPGSLVESPLSSSSSGHPP